MNVQLKGMNDFQVMGSAITYLRRYSLSSVLGLVTDKDTDAGGEQLSKPKDERETLSNDRFEKAVEKIRNKQLASNCLTCQRLFLCCALIQTANLQNLHVTINLPSTHLQLLV